MLSILNYDETACHNVENNNGALHARVVGQQMEKRLIPELNGSSSPSLQTNGEEFRSIVQESAPLGHDELPVGDELTEETLLDEYICRKSADAEDSHAELLRDIEFHNAKKRNQLEESILMIDAPPSKEGTSSLGAQYYKDPESFIIGGESRNSARGPLFNSLSHILANQTDESAELAVNNAD